MKKHLDKFFIKTNISVLKKNILLKNYFHLKDDKNYIGGLCIKMYLWLLKYYMKSKKIAPKIYQNILTKQYIFLLKTTSL